MSPLHHRRIVARTLAALACGLALMLAAPEAAEQARGRHAAAPADRNDPPLLRRAERGRRAPGAAGAEAVSPRELGDQDRPTPGTRHVPRERRLERAGTFDGDLRQLPQSRRVRKRERPEREGPDAAPLVLPGTATPSANDLAPSDVGAPQALNAPAPGPSSSFEGLNFTTWGAGHPPDTNGDVGPTYYIETINTALGIFDKASGSLVAGFTFDTFMSQGQFGNLCDTDNFGDPVALYDSFEDRWIVTDFAFTLDGAGNVINPPGAYQCFAVSKSGDPIAGGWNYYSINTEGGLGDYPKLGIWPDGLYMSVNMFGYSAAGAFQNVRLYALNKAQMYAGAPSVQVVSFDAPASEFTLLPANARLQTGTPPTGSPNYFASVWNYLNAVGVWKFHVDWNSVSLSTLTGPYNTITATNWSQLTSSTVPSPINRLDTLYPRLMMQNQYSNIGGVESLWNAHTVGASGTSSAQSAVRYYQVKVTGGAVEANATQAFTFNPDTLNRFMPSVAVDRAGNMAIGYSATSATVFPAIRYAGRLAGDAANTITQTEASLIEGTGSQSGNCGGSNCQRWGDYSAMTLDPDGCTFWYTNEYYPVSGLDHHTRIGAFSFAACTPAGIGTLQGTVKTSAAVPIAGATVTLGSRTTTTDGNGNYAFADLPAGTYPAAAATKQGFSTASFTAIVIPEGGTATRDFVLSTAPLTGCAIDTTQADFQAGVPANCDLTGSPGDVRLVSVPAVDQQNLSVTSSGFGFNSTSWAGQTFTPAVTGQLIRVDLDLFCSSCTGTTPNLTVSIRATTGNPPLPTGGDLASATIPGFSSGAGGFFSAVFAVPPALIGGARYAIVIRPVSNPSAGVYAYVCSCGTGNTGTNPYAGGQRVTSASSGGTWAADTVAGGRDLGFVTYMQSGFSASGSFVSSIKDANPPLGGSAAWGAISWTADVPGGTTLRFQAAASNSASGPFTFVGPDGTSGTYFASGASLAQFNGLRYLKYKALLTTSSGAVSPVVHDVTVCFNNVPPIRPTAIAVSPASATYGGVATLSATLTALGAPVSGKSISFTLNGSPAGSAATNASGVATLAGVSVAGIAAGTYPNGAGASFAGDASYEPSTGSNTLAIDLSPAVVAQALLAGANRLGPPMQHADGGWYFLASATSCGIPPASPELPPPSCRNLYGINGLGLLEAYRHNPTDTALLDYARAAGNALVAIFAAEDPLAHSRPLMQDVEFLGALSQTSGDASYMTVATQWFAVIVSQDPSAAARVDTLFAIRNSQSARTYGAWDAASMIRAARAVGNLTYATDAANRVVERESDRVDGGVPYPGWKYTVPGTAPPDNIYGYDYTILAEGSLLTSIYDLPGFEAKRDEYRAFLLATQDPEGTWDGGNLQMTAYITKGLIALGDVSTTAAVTKAVNFFANHQLPNGGWPFYISGTQTGSEYTEVDSEVMQALSALYNTPMGSSVTLQPSPLAALRIPSVTHVGTTTVTAVDPATTGTLPAGYALAPYGYKAATTAGIDAGGGIAVCLWAPTITDPVVFENLRALHAEDGVLVDRTITRARDPLAPDFATRTICARVDALGPFALGVYHRSPPRIRAPRTVVAEAASPAGAAVTFDVSAADRVDGELPVTCTPSSGSTFPIGTTVVRCSATNAAGMTAHAAISVRVLKRRPTRRPD